VVLVSALVSGAALLTLLVALFSRQPREPKGETVKLLARLTMGLLALDLLLVASDILTTMYGEVPHETGAWLSALFGPQWWVFWLLQVGVGGLLPILLVILPGTGRRIGWLGLAGLLVLLGMAGARFNLVVPAQLTPAFELLAGAYHHPRYALGYTPSVQEWLVVLGVTALGVWMFLAAFRLFPLEVAKLKPTQEGGPLA